MPLPPHIRSSRPHRSRACGLLFLLLPLALAAHEADQARAARLRELVHALPGDAALRFELASILALHGDWEAVLAEVDQVDQSAPGTFPTDRLRGQAWVAKERYAEAVRAFDRRLAVAPSDVAARLPRARALVRLGESARALADFRECLRLNPAPDPDLVLEVADALAAHGEPGEALLALDAAVLRLGPAPALILRAIDLELAAGRVDAALARVEVQRRAAPRPEPWMARRASVLARAGRLPDSEAAWQDLILHLDSLPPAQRSSHAMLRQREDARHALAALRAMAPPAPPPHPPSPSSLVVP